VRRWFWRFACFQNIFRLPVVSAPQDAALEFSAPGAWKHGHRFAVLGEFSRYFDDFQRVMQNHACMFAHGVPL
jgi:hypothetical protein